MGADIHGRVEIYRDGKWHSVLDVGQLLWRNYDMFGLFFGVRNYADFVPVAEDRGMPDDLSEGTRSVLENWESDGHSYSWFGMNDVEALDWNQESSRFDERIHVFVKGRYAYKFESGDGLTEDEMKRIRQGETVVKGDRSYHAEKMRAKDALSADWLRLFRLMSLLGERYGRENVRAAVWFDN